jgi:SAM-dependent methyltransferase
LNILERDDLRVLDIGAGYGRLAHRMLEAAPRIKSYTCVDAVPESTFLCEFYLQYRGLQDRVEVLPADELERHFDNGRYDLALNIHSFSECTYAAIEWWLRSLQKMDVRYLMIVPNSPESFLSLEKNRNRLDYAPLLRNLGYELIAREPVFEDPAVQQLMEVRDNMYLFERKGAAR